MAIKNATFAAAAVVLAAGLAGCWDSTEVTVHNPGQYKGEMAPLLAKPAPARRRALRAMRRASSTRATHG